MTPQLQIRPASFDGDLDDQTPWSILSIADHLVGRSRSTTTRLGIPVVAHEVGSILLRSEGMTGSAASPVSHLWQTYLSSTETGITYMALSRPVGEEVQRLRDEIARRTRLTRQQIARAVGVDRRSLSAWVSGEATPNPEKLERLRLLADIIRDIDVSAPETATEILLSRRNGQDLLDHLAAGRITAVDEWHPFGGTTPSATIQERRRTKRPLHQNALDAYLRGELRELGRATTVHPESDYEQDLSRAERVMPDEPVRRSRRGYK